MRFMYLQLNFAKIVRAKSPCSLPWIKVAPPIGRLENYMSRSIISFIFNQIIQQSAAAPSRIWFLSLGHNPCSHEPNILAKVGGWIPKVICTVFQRKLTKWQSKKEYMLDSFIETTETTFEIWHFASSFLLKLSFVSVIPFFKYHRRILVSVLLLISKEDFCWEEHLVEALFRF